MHKVLKSTLLIIGLGSTLGYASPDSECVTSVPDQIKSSLNPNDHITYPSESPQKILEILYTDDDSPELQHEVTFQCRDCELGPTLPPTKMHIGLQACNSALFIYGGWKHQGQSGEDPETCIFTKASDPNTFECCMCNPNPSKKSGVCTC